MFQTGLKHINLIVQPAGLAHLIHKTLNKYFFLKTIHWCFLKKVWHVNQSWSSWCELYFTCCQPCSLKWKTWTIFNALVSGYWKALDVWSSIGSETWRIPHRLSITIYLNISCIICLSCFRSSAPYDLSLLKLITCWFMLLPLLLLSFS